MVFRGDEGLRETFRFVTNNAAQLDATKTTVFQDKDNAERDNNLPHNVLMITNLDTTSTIFGYFDLQEDQDKPDFTVFPQQQGIFGLEDGISYTNLFIKNTHATNNIAAGDIKVRMATIKRID